MRPISMPVIASALIVTCVAVASAAGQPRDESTILEFEQRLAAAWANGDRIFIDRLLAPDWTVIDQAGRILTKQQVLDETFSSARAGMR